MTCTSGYYISPTVSSNIFSLWLLLTVGDQIGLLGTLLHEPWSGPLDLTLVHCIGPGSGDARECQGGHLGCPWDIYADEPGLY